MEKLSVCKYNQFLDCERHICGKCGWNPDVEKKRKAKFVRKKLGKPEKWIVGEKKDYKKDVTTFAEEV